MIKIRINAFLKKQMHLTRLAAFFLEDTAMERKSNCKKTSTVKQNQAAYIFNVFYFGNFEKVAALNLNEERLFIIIFDLSFFLIYVFFACCCLCCAQIMHIII